MVKERMSTAQDPGGPHIVRVMGRPAGNTDEGSSRHQGFDRLGAGSYR